MQNIKKIKNIAFCGGGIYGYGEVGALIEMQNYTKYFDIQNISGVSVGSIVACLYAVGYTPDELQIILFEFDFDDLIKGSARLPYLKFYEKFGMYDADGLENEIERLISQKTNIKMCTFSQIQKNLTIIATNLNYQRATFFNRDQTPDMVISKAVRMSISYPGYITPVLYNNDLYGDGGESMNYPIVIYNDLQQTIGITFASIYENNDGTLKSRIPINNIYDYIVSLALTMSRSVYVSQVTAAHLSRSIIIQITENIASMQLNLTSAQKKLIYECGVNSVKNQISKILEMQHIQ